MEVILPHVLSPSQGHGNSLNLPSPFFKLIKCQFVDVIVKRNSRKSFQERIFAALVVDKIACNPRDLAVALKLSDLDISEAGGKIKRNTALDVLGWYGVSFRLLISLSSRFRVITTGT
jgi:hypothetical protein